MNLMCIGKGTLGFKLLWKYTGAENGAIQEVLIILYIYFFTISQLVIITSFPSP
jgi:hypothetical protein